MKQLSHNITSFLMRENIIKKDDFEIYYYGMKHLIINIMMFLVIGIMAAISHMYIATIFFFLGLMPLRLTAGGYHANTPQRCVVISIAVYISNLIIIYLIQPILNFEILFIISAFIVLCIFLLAPVDHKNRMLSQDEYKQIRIRSRLIAGCIATLVVIGSLVFKRSVIVTGTMMGAFTASVSLIIGYLKRRDERNEENEMAN